MITPAQRAERRNFMGSSDALAILAGLRQTPT
jgi:hypothetical protein